MGAFLRERRATGARIQSVDIVTMLAERLQLQFSTRHACRVAKRAGFVYDSVRSTWTEPAALVVSAQPGAAPPLQPPAAPMQPAGADQRAVADAAVRLPSSDAAASSALAGAAT